MMKKESYLAQVYLEVMTAFSDVVKIFNKSIQRGVTLKDTKEQFARNIYILLIESGLYEFEYMFEAKVLTNGQGMLMIRPIQDKDRENDDCI